MKNNLITLTLVAIGIGASVFGIPIMWIILLVVVGTLIEFAYFRKK